MILTESRQNFQDFTLKIRRKKILITGGTGFFGKNLVDIISYGNANFNWETEVIILSRSSVLGDLGPGIKHFQSDLENPLDDIGTLKLDYIIHAASPLNLPNQLQPEKTYHAIVNSMSNILNFAARVQPESLLFTSSGAVYGPQPAAITHISEDYLGAPSTTDLRFVYGSAKRSAETLGILKAKESGFKFKIARCFAFSGHYLPLDSHFAMGNFVENLLRKQPIVIKGNPHTLRSYMDAEDLCFWLLKILFDGCDNEFYNVGSDQPISILQLANVINKFAPELKVITRMENIDSALTPPAYVPCTQKAQKSLNLEMKTSLTDSILKMIERNLP